MKGRTVALNDHDERGREELLRVPAERRASVDAVHEPAAGGLLDGLEDERVEDPRDVDRKSVV